MHTKLHKVLALIVTTALVITNSSGISAAAEGKDKKATTSTFVSRFPGNNKDDNDNNNKSDGDSENGDEDWVEHKDDMRHGIGSSSGSTASASGDKGNATGDQAVELCDGSWYWYHQSTNACAYNSNADGSLNLGICQLSIRSPKTFTDMGCGLWSTSMILSNLYNRPICIDEMLEKMGATVSGNIIQVPSGAGYMDTSSGSDDVFAESVATAWDLDYDAWTSGRDSAESKAAVDACLDAGGMVRFRYGAPNDTVSSTAWPYFSTDGHFITIRNRTDDGKYLILDSCFHFCTDMEGSKEKADRPIEWDTIFQHAQWSKSKVTRPYGFICFTPKGGSSSSNSRLKSDSKDTSTNKSNSASWNSECSWYGPGTDIAKFTKKQDLGNDFYLYDGLPWDADSNTYTVDTDTALNDWFVYMEDKSGGKIKYGDDSEASARDIIDNSNRVKEVTGSKLKGDSSAWKEKDGGSYAEVDGLQAVPICVPPMVVDTYYNNNFKDSDKLSKDNWKNSNTASELSYNFGKSKMAIALYEKSTRKIWFLPVVNCSELNETYQGGIANTSFEVKDGDKAIKDANKSNGGKSTADFVNTIAEFWDLPDSVKTVIGSTTDYAVCGYVVWN